MIIFIGCYLAHSCQSLIGLRISSHCAITMQFIIMGQHGFLCAVFLISCVCLGCLLPASCKLVWFCFGVSHNRPGNAMHVICKDTGLQPCTTKNEPRHVMCCALKTKASWVLSHLTCLVLLIRIPAAFAS